MYLKLIEDINGSIFSARFWFICHIISDGEYKMFIKIWSCSYEALALLWWQYRFGWFIWLYFVLFNISLSIGTAFIDEIKCIFSFLNGCYSQIVCFSLAVLFFYLLFTMYDESVVILCSFIVSQNLWKQHLLISLECDIDGTRLNSNCKVLLVFHIL